MSFPVGYTPIGIRKQDCYRYKTLFPRLKSSFKVKFPPRFFSFAPVKFKNIVRITAVALLLLTVLCATTISDFHYAFGAAQHGTAHNDNCDHHLHANNKHGECFICKIDQANFVGEVVAMQSIRVFFLASKTTSLLQTAFFCAVKRKQPTRGPPALI